MHKLSPLDSAFLLAKSQELPAHVAMLPISLRPPGSTAEGNFVTKVQVKPRHTGEDPADGLQTVRDSMRTARAIYADVSAAAAGPGIN